MILKEFLSNVILRIEYYLRNAIKTAKIKGKEPTNYKNQIIAAKKIAVTLCNRSMKCNLNEIN